MLTKTIIAAAFLAQAVFAAPYGAANTTSTTSAAPAATATATTVTLDKTQQLLLSDTQGDRFKILNTNDQFVFPFKNVAAAGAGKGGNLTLANRKNFPALVGTNSAMAVGFLGPCGLNTPHVHTRSTELQIVVQGQLYVEMVAENGVTNPDGTLRVISNTVNQFEMTPFYQGYIHTQFNPTCEETIFVASFASEDPGTSQTAQAFLSLTDDLIGATLGDAVDGAEIDKIRGLVPASIAQGVETCLKTCGIAKK